MCILLVHYFLFVGTPIFLYSKVLSVFVPTAELTYGGIRPLTPSQTYIETFRVLQ